MSEEVKTQGQLDAEEERRKSVVDKTKDGKRNVFWPGHINYADERGHQAGCKAAWFKDVDAWNTWSETEGGNNLTVYVQFLETGHVGVLYTSKLEKAELEEFNDFNRDYAEWKRKRQEERDAQRIRDEEERIKQESLKREKAEAEERENKRLIHLGRTHEANCSKKAKKEKA